MGFIQFVSGSAGSGPNTVTSPSLTLTAGNNVIVIVGVGNNSQQTVTSVTDSGGVNTYHFATGSHGFNGGTFGGTAMETWYAENVTGGALTVTGHWPSGGGYSFIYVVEYSGLATSSSLLTANASSGNSASPTASVVVGVTITPTSAGCSSAQWVATSAAFKLSPLTGYLVTCSVQAVNTGCVWASGPSGNMTDRGGGGNLIFGEGIAPLLPYFGYGSEDQGGIALPAQEPLSTIFAAQTNSLAAPIEGGSKGPTNVGVFYQSGGGGGTPGQGQIFPTGRS